MTEAEMDALVARLVPEFEDTRLKALLARQDYLVVTTGRPVDRKLAADLRERWQAHEERCAAILLRIDALAEATVA